MTTHDGYFSDRSMVVRALRQRVVGLTYGERALVIGATHPVLFIGTAQHTAHRESPWSRLALTARLFETVFLGSRAEADKALAFTAHRHAAVAGTTSVDGGPHAPAGTPYDAARGDLMWMTAAFTLDSVEAMHDLLVRRLTPGEREALFADFVDWACLFGMPRSAAPASYDTFRQRMDERLAGEAFLTDEARLVGGYLAGAGGYPLPGPAALGSPVLATIVTGSLPATVRELYGITWNPAQEAVFGSIALASRLAHQRVPFLDSSPLLRGVSRDLYRGVAATERRHLRRGGVSMPGVSDVEAPYVS